MGSEISSLCGLNRTHAFHIKQKPVLKTSKFRRQKWLAATRKKRERSLLAGKMFKRYPRNTTNITTNPSHKITLTFCLQIKSSSSVSPLAPSCGRSFFVLLSVSVIASHFSSPVLRGTHSFFPVTSPFAFAVSLCWRCRVAALK